MYNSFGHWQNTFIFRWKMEFMSKNFLSLALLLFIFSSCENRKQPKELPLVFKNDKIEKKSGEGCLEDAFNCSKIILDFPVSEGAKSSKKINEAIKNHLAQLIYNEENPKIASAEELAKNFISEHQKSVEKFEEAMPWQASVNAKVYFQSKNLISIGFNSEVFKGGAHGYRSLSFLNLNSKSGEIYTQKELFTEDFIEFAEKIFRQEQNIPKNDNINSTGFWFENDIFALPINIGFDKENVILVYNPYEIAAYSDGQFLLKIPKEKLKPFLKLEKDE